MTERIEKLRALILSNWHHRFRRQADWQLDRQFAAENLPPVRRSAAAGAAVLNEEQPVFIPGAQFAFMRTVKNLPDLYTPEEWENMRKKYTFSEKGVPFNFTVDYQSVLAAGLPQFREEIFTRRNRESGEKREFLDAALLEIDALLRLLDRYIAAAGKEQFLQTEALLKAVRSRAPETFAEALQLFRIIHYALWCEGGYHLGAGRIDQLFYPYLKQDLDNGRITLPEALETLEEFFLTFNIDSDLYCGVQQGDNGQSVMIGGCDPDGNDAWNYLSEMILRASCELKLIDPKINFRVNRSTPLSRLALGSELTRAGLGFPQYSNDDVVIPALVKWGYSPADARNYSCAACWEFIIPALAHELVNLDAVSLPEAILSTMRRTRAENFGDFCRDLQEVLREKAVGLLEYYRNIRTLPSPLASVCCPPGLAAAGNITENGKYHNWGIHGTGFAVAADSLTAIRMAVFEMKKITMPELLEILEKNFSGNEQLKTFLRQLPKAGSGHTAELEKLSGMWEKAWDGLKNSQGGIVRPGTGSAMYYIWHSRELPATPDGREAGDAFPANFSPSLDRPLSGPLSIIRDFTAPDLTGVCNGGPLTIELHDSVFSAENAGMKLAALIADFIRRGGHQLQLNTINRETLLDAQKHPEKYPNLIVRVWGWSGRFVELDEVYQQHIIRRSQLSLP
ncbi:MAG: pyruvate formate-lyase [Lentisphaeria bacterium]|nr:pyruvate formate-lyase [Lentisphaeria bacterium]